MTGGFECGRSSESALRRSDLGVLKRSTENVKDLLSIAIRRCTIRVTHSHFAVKSLLLLCIVTVPYWLRNPVGTKKEVSFDSSASAEDGVGLLNLPPSVVKNTAFYCNSAHTDQHVATSRNR